ncbi:MAG: stage V sporulation protein AB [Christensenellales bacterium]|jgi:stage V sporulation protein AB
MTHLLSIVTGFAMGAFSGVTISAVFIGLKIIPRLFGILDGKRYLIYGAWSFFFGAICGGIISLMPVRFSFPVWSTIPIGLFYGIFIGILAMALAEFLGAFPRVASRLGIGKYVLFLVAAILLGKVAFSLMFWLTPIFQ